MSSNSLPSLSLGMLLVLFFVLSKIRNARCYEDHFQDTNRMQAEGDEFATKCMYEAMLNVNRAIRRTDIHWRKDTVWDSPMDLFQFFKRPPNEDAERMARASDIFETTVNYVNEKVLQKYRRMKRRVNATDVLSSKTLRDLAAFSGCIGNPLLKQCPDTCIASKYRTITGQCNNLQNVYWGSSNHQLVRWQPSQYENGFSHPIGWNAETLRNNYRMPLVRKVSNDIIQTSNTNVTDDTDYSHMLVVWGQYIDHDFDLTPQSLSTSTFQGLTNCQQTCRNEPPCFPILLPGEDSKRADAECLPFFRSSAVCGSGETSSLFNELKPREQMNAVTSFLDASTVYGSTDRMAYNLRNHTTDEGLMRVNDRFYDEGGRIFLPFNPNNPCVQDQSDASGERIPCFTAGDPRVSEHLTLSAIHTLWVRAHNRIARELKRINPHWYGETIYQEARKIVGSLHQIVHYKEYVPKIIGMTGMNLLGEYSEYNPSVNPTISNVFATAAFRFGHVTIAPIFRRLDGNFNEHPTHGNIFLHEAFFSPWRIIRQGGLDPIFRGLIGRPAKLITGTQIMHEELREKLFQLQNKVALDLASLNLQRGRDHAIPLYSYWREFCNLTRVETFDELASEISDASVELNWQNYTGHPGNLDLWLAGLVEDLVPGSRVGPTFLCLLTKQFQYLRDGDRFFYERVHTDEQIEELEKIRLANVLCYNSGLETVQRDVFSLAQYPDDFVRCSDLDPLNLEPWREEPEVGSCGRPQNIEYGDWQRCNDLVSYRCKMGFYLDGQEELTCMDNGAFNAEPPMCVDVNECDQELKCNCEDICMNTVGSCRCMCSDGKILNEDGRTCSESPVTVVAPVGTNVAAIVTGVVLGVALLVLVVAVTYGVHKYTLLMQVATQAGTSSVNTVKMGISNSGFDSSSIDKTNMMH
uniref:Homologue of mammlian thyroid peroxidase n=1 Tax=Halocynthia roretzi TaxID=7729 RepID=Q9XXZ8_HALRO|nr:homologue of mammlian thyroid peroxidase [Halocynthia roretzi]